MEKVTSRDIAGRVTPPLFPPVLVGVHTQVIRRARLLWRRPVVRPRPTPGAAYLTGEVGRARGIQAALSPANSRYPLYLSFSPSLFLSLSLERAHSLALARSLPLSIYLSLSRTHTLSRSLSVATSHREQVAACEESHPLAAALEEQIVCSSCLDVYRIPPDSGER